MRITLLITLLMSSVVFLSNHHAAAQATDCEAGFRLVEHELLAEPICVPENPQRVVAVQLTAFELMVMLDIAPVARPDDSFLTALYGGAPEVYDRVLEIAGEAPAFGAFDPNLEVVAADIKVLMSSLRERHIRSTNGDSESRCSI